MVVLTKIPSRALALSSKLRFPSIRFRYGSDRNTKTSAASAAAGHTAQKQHQSTGDSIYDFQLPMRFRRKPMDQEEIDYINRGGPA